MQSRLPFIKRFLDLVIGQFNIIVLVLLVLPGCQTLPPEDAAPTLIPGEITENKDTYGTYYLYQPTTLADPPQTLVVIHGTPAKDLTAGETAL